MKKILLTALFIAGIINGSNAQINNKTQKDVTAYFTAVLNGDSSATIHNKSVKPKKIKETRTAVWECWRNAVEKMEEDKLPVAVECGKKDTIYWQMPTHPEPGTVMPFHYISKGEKPTDGYPFFLYMHGSGPKKQEWETGYTICSSFNDAPSLYFIPQIPSEKHYRWAIPTQQWAWEKLLRLAFLSGEVDANKIFFFGISEGGYGSQRLASFYADYLAGAGPMAGGEPLQNAPAENLANIAFSLRTGEKDYGFGRNYMTHIALKTLDSLCTAHPGLYNHHIELIPNMGHGINYEATTPWLVQFKRNPHPAYFYWEDYDMYGRHRKGFYNLRVNEPSTDNEQQRTCYEVSRNGNTINITVKNVTYTTRESLYNIPMVFKKNFTPATKGNITIFLNEDIIDLAKPVTITVNGHTTFNGKVKPCIKAMAESCALFFDPERVFPAAIDVDIK